jgi:hypothetical protein
MMNEDDSFSIQVDCDLIGRYRWSTYRSGGLHERSTESFATRLDAAVDAVSALRERVLAERRAATGIFTLH